jgi:uncharacterized repeat protein (TIGR01451 family)
MNVAPIRKTTLAAVTIAGLLLTGVLLQSLATHADEKLVPTDVLYVCPACAYTTIQAAVDAAYDDDTIHIVQGTYTSTSPGQVVVINEKDLTLLGGWAPDFSERDPKTYTTTIDGQDQRMGLWSESNDIVLDGLNFINGNQTTGGVGVEEGSVTIANCTFFDNYGADAGAILIIGAACTLTNNIVSHNTSGPGAEGGPVTLECTGSVISNVISHNQGNTNGGGLYVLNFSAGSHLAIISNTIHNNSAQYGGGLSIRSVGAVTLTNNRIFSNTAANGHGGGVYLENSDNVLIGGNFITSNIVTGGYNGGGVYVNNSDAILDGNSIFANVAGNGGGIYLDSSAATLVENTISANSVGDGGTGSGVVLNLSPAKLISNTITGNGECEGAVRVDNSDGARLSGNTITSNTGEGIFLVVSSATLDNNVIAGHTATGVHMAGSNVRLRHNTIARNAGTAGLYVGYDIPYYSNVALTNTILVSHTVGIVVVAGTTATLEATLWGTGTWANDSDWTGAGSITTGTVNLWKTPAFVDPDAGDYHIAPGSAAIDSGVDAGIAVDIDGDPRPISTGYDIGADEFPAALEVVKEADPTVVQSGEQLTYTIRITNTGNVTLTTVVTDILPAHVFPTGVLTWTPVIATGGTWTEYVPVTVPLDHAGLLTNVVWVTAEEGVTGFHVETSTARFPSPGFADVLINEIAWSGTPASPDHEWMELRSAHPYTLRLDTCTLAAQDGTPTILLAGLIAPYGYFLLERYAIATDVPYDLLYSGALDDDGELLTLTCDGSVVDQVDASTGWPAGHDGGGDPPVATMERHTEPGDGWHANDGVLRNGLASNGQPINGTPRASNSPLHFGLALASDQTAGVYPGDAVAFTHILTNTGNATDAYTITLETATVGGQVDPMTTTLYASRHIDLHLTVTVPITVDLYTTHTVTLTARSWSSPTVSATNVDTVTILCRAPTHVGIAGPLTGVTGTPYTFTATITPSNATLPITYTWSPMPVTGQGTTTATYTWTHSGQHTITLTAEGCGRLVTDVHTITIAAPPCYGIDEVAISGPLTGTTGMVYPFTASVSPPTATTAITYTWTPTPTAGQGTATATYTWAITGQHSITTVAENRCSGPVTATHTITISSPPPCYGLEGVTISGPLTATSGISTVFTASISPGVATPPITFTWTPRPTAGQGTAAVTYTWAVTGQHVITVVAVNCGGAVTATHTITVSSSPLPCYGLDGVTVTGSLTGTTNALCAFTAGISPYTATPPIVYTWAPEPFMGQGDAVVTYTWTITGLHTISVSARNCGGTVTGSGTITISLSPPPPPIYLPFIVRGWPPVHHLDDTSDNCPGYGPLELMPHRYVEDFDHQYDKDWYTFPATVDTTYTIRTSGLGVRADTVLFLYTAGCPDPDSVGRETCDSSGHCVSADCVCNDDCEGDPASGSCITWQSPASGEYHIFVRNYNWHWDHGPGTDYTLTIQEAR